MKKLIAMIIFAAVLWCNGKALFIWVPPICTIEENTGIGNEPEEFWIFTAEENTGIGDEEC